MDTSKYRNQPLCLRVTPQPYAQCAWCKGQIDMLGGIGLFIEGTPMSICERCGSDEYNELVLLKEIADSIERSGRRRAENEARLYEQDLRSGRSSEEVKK